MTRHLAVYWAKDRIRVNCLSPGPFPSERAPAEPRKEEKALWVSGVGGRCGGDLDCVAPLVCANQLSHDALFAEALNDPAAHRTHCRSAEVLGATVWPASIW